jgi:hypothetical protein
MKRQGYDPSKYDRVILRRWRSAPHDLIAVFPDEPGTNSPHTCSSYMHVGQHGSCDWHLAIVPQTEPVRSKTVYGLPSDAAALLAELKQIGYHPRLVQRMPRDALSIRHNKIKAMDAAAETRALDAKYGFGAPTT